MPVSGRAQLAPTVQVAQKLWSEMNLREQNMHLNKLKQTLGGNMKSITVFVLGMAMALIGDVPASAQMGAMGGNMPENIAKMMQEPNKVLAQASIQYMNVFTQSLHVQAKERRDQIDEEFIKSAFAEMKKSFGLLERFQSAHVKTMDENVQSKVQPMMEKMDKNLTLVKKNLDDLEQEVNGSRDLGKIALFTGEIIKGLDDMPRRVSGMPGMSGEKPGMQK
jgi:hypothetical protein